MHSIPLLIPDCCFRRQHFALLLRPTSDSFSMRFPILRVHRATQTTFKRTTTRWHRREMNNHTSSTYRSFQTESSLYCTQTLRNSSHNIQLRCSLCKVHTHSLAYEAQRVIIIVLNLDGMSTMHCDCVCTGTLRKRHFISYAFNQHCANSNTTSTEKYHFKEEK